MKMPDWMEREGKFLPDLPNHNGCSHPWSKHKMMYRGMHANGRYHTAKEEIWCTIKFCRCHYWSQG